MKLECPLCGQFEVQEIASDGATAESHKCSACGFLLNAFFVTESSTDGGLSNVDA